MIAYKFLRADGTSVFTNFSWPLPGSGSGPWIEAAVDPCRSGIHGCRRADLPLWIGRSLYEIELDGPIDAGPTKVVAPRGRLLRRIDGWDEASCGEYTRMCADRAHELARGRDLSDWEALVEPSVPEGPALLGFIAARIAEEASGPAGYREERRRQADWLADRLGI